MGCKKAEGEYLQPAMDSSGSKKELRAVGASSPAFFPPKLGCIFLDNNGVSENEVKILITKLLNTLDSHLVTVLHTKSAPPHPPKTNK